MFKPGLGGIPLCRIFSRKFELPVVLLVEHGANIDRAMGGECGAQDYLVKPAHPEDLVARVRYASHRTFSRAIRTRRHCMAGASRQYGYNGRLRSTHTFRHARLQCRISPAGARAARLFACSPAILPDANQQGDEVTERQQPDRAAALDRLAQYPLLDALLGRRSRRFGRGMRIDGGPLAYSSRHAPQPLSEIEEAMLVFAACGLTGFTLADVDYAAGQGGSMLAGLLGRTIASPDAINAVSLVVTNDTATYLIRRPQEFDAQEILALAQLARQRDFLELYRRMRIKIADGRAAPPVKPGFNFNINQWALYAPGSTYLLPVNSMTAAYINVLLEAFDPAMGLFGIDERNVFQPAGLGRFAKSRGGALDDDPNSGRVFTVQAIEQALVESISIEQGMLQQNIALMVQALGLGGFPNFARHEYSWFEALGFHMGQMPSSRYAGANSVITLILKLLGRDAPYPYPLGLERSGAILLKPFCPPYYTTMQAAVEAFVAFKYGPRGIRPDQRGATDWQNPAGVTAQIPPPNDQAVAATAAYCDYLYRRYGRFPAYSAPFRTMLGYQATHVDEDFYDRFYTPAALTGAQREHQARWHAVTTAAEGAPR
jgi:CheY-like chemotaxis protein